MSVYILRHKKEAGDFYIIENDKVYSFPRVKLGYKWRRKSNLRFDQLELVAVVKPGEFTYEYYGFRK